MRYGIRAGKRGKEAPGYSTGESVHWVQEVEEGKNENKSESQFPNPRKRRKVKVASQGSHPLARG
jgi:hypothetical protein